MSTVSRSELLAKKLLDHYFFQVRKLDNYRPLWLEGLELDRFYPDLGVGIEFQGRQHFMSVPEMSKNQEGFERQLYKDQRKRAAVEKQGLKLIALDVFDLTPERMKRYALQIKDWGKVYAGAGGNIELLRRLEKIRFDLYPDPELFKGADRLSRTPLKKKSFWSRIFDV